MKRLKLQGTLKRERTCDKCGERKISNFFFYEDEDAGMFVICEECRHEKK